MTKKTKLNQKDRDHLAAALSGVTPLKLKHQKVQLKTKPEKGINKSIPQPQDLLTFNEAHYEKPVTGDTILAYKDPSISHKILRNLSKGQYNVDAMIDLHGMTVEEAREALLQFLSQCLRKHIRVALIIHGRRRSGEMPVLKNKLNIWLRSTRTVLAFCSADPSHGSQGALYVLLKRYTEAAD